MCPAPSICNSLDKQAQLDREQSEILCRQRESEKEDREFVRAALRDALPDDEIERRLLVRTRFVRLNPSRDGYAYVRGLIDEEESWYHGLSSHVPLSLDEPPLPAKLGSDTRPAQAKSLTTGPAPASRAKAAEAAVPQYLNENFRPSDWLAVVVRNRETGETVQRISTAERIARPEFQAWLRYKNILGSDIYISLNTFKDHIQGRTKADLKEIRHLYLDLDEDGPPKLASIRQDTAVPAPHFVLNTSPEKYLVVWKVEGIGQEEAETMLRALAQRFRNDPAATDSTHVFRVPGYSNKQYEDDFQVTITPEAPRTQVYHATDFKIQGLAPEHDRSSLSSNSSALVPVGPPS